MSTGTVDRCVAGAALAPLDSAERQELARLGRRAWARLRPDLQRGGTTPRHSSDAAAFDEWRHQQCLMAVERHGLRECRKEDYGFLRAHFLGLLGQDEAARRWRARATMEPRRQAMAKLRQAMREAEDVIARPEEYVRAIAKCRYHGTPIEELSERQIWGLCFDLRRGAQKRRKRVDGVPF